MGSNQGEPLYIKVRLRTITLPCNFARKGPQIAC